MPQTIRFSDDAHVVNPITGAGAQAVSSGLFGGIFLDIQAEVGGMVYHDHFDEVSSYISLGLLRYPDGELPDGFAIAGGDGVWRFVHNKFNGNDRTIRNPITGDEIPQDQMFDQAYLDQFTPALSLTYPDLLHPSLLIDPTSGEETGRLGLSGALRLAANQNVPFSMVLPEFQYLRPPVNRDPDGNGVKSTFVANDHVKLSQLVDDLSNFLGRLFLDDSLNQGNLPTEIILEIGNEDYFGWNQYYFDKDSNTDLDSYSAYTYGCLLAIRDFRAAHPEYSFLVSMQAHGAQYVNEIAANFDDMNASALFAEIDVIDTAHVGLGATVSSIADLELDWSIQSGLKSMNALIVAAGGSASDTRFYNSAWGTSSSDIVEFGNSNNGLPSASAALSLFSGFATLEMDYAANWGIGAWTGSGISSTDVVNGKVTYSPYAEIMRLMAESLVGTFQVGTPTMNGSRDDDVLAFAFEDDAKAVIFLAANDFVGHELVTLDGFGEIGYVWAERISSSGDAVSGFETEVSREVLTANGLDILVHFDKPFEIVRLIVSREDPGFGELHLWGDETADTLRGGMSGDFLEGNGGADHISGRDGNDTIHGGSGNDVLYGNDGNDFMSGGPGEDRIVGGLGVDTLSYLDANSGVSIWIDDQITESPEGDDTFRMIERYLGSDFGDTIRDFVTNAIEIDSRAGDDTVLISNATGVVTQLGDGDDSYIDYGVGNTVSGGEGDDTFLVFGDAANVFGGLGDDEIVLGSGSYNVHFSHGGGNDRIRGFTPDTDHLHLEEALFEFASSGTAEVLERDGAWGISFGHDTAIWFPDLLAADLIGILEDVSLF